MGKTSCSRLVPPTAALLATMANLLIAGHACKRWSDRMIEHQQKMIPKGAYYMQYGRRPGQEQGNWYVADCSSIALGGVTDGYWPKSDKEWWCSTGIYGSLAFCLYHETGNERYLTIGRGTIDWLNRQDLLTVAKHYPPESIKPTGSFVISPACSAKPRNRTSGISWRCLR